MDTLLLIAVPLLILIGYLYLWRYLRKKGDTPIKRAAFRLSVRVHKAAWVCVLLSTILLSLGILLRWGLTWYLYAVFILSGITIYLSMPQELVHRRLWKCFSGIFYWGVAAMIPLWYCVYIVIMLFSHAQVFENRQFSIRLEAISPFQSMYEGNIVYKKSGPFLKELTTFRFDRSMWEIHDVETYGKDAIQIHLRGQECYGDSIASAPNTAEYIFNINDKSMRIPLKQGEGNPAIYLSDDISINPINAYIQPSPWSEVAPQAWLQMTIYSQDEDVYETSFNYWRQNDDQHPNDFPRAIGEYLLDLDARGDSMALLIRTLKPGDTFVFDRKWEHGIQVGGLSISYESGSVGEITFPKAGYNIINLFRLSANGEEEVVTFEYVSTHDDNVSSIEWKGYRVEVLGNHSEPLRMRVTKE